MINFEARYARFVIAHPLFVIIVPLVLVLACATGARHLSFDSDYRSFFEKDNPDLIAWDKLSETYTETNSIVFILEPADGNVFTRETLGAIEFLTERAWQIPFSIRVDSLSNYQHTRAEEDDLTVSDLIRNAEALSDAEVEYVRNVALAEPLLLHRLVSSNGAVTSVNVRIPLGDADKTVAFTQINAALAGLGQEFKQRYPSIELYRGGEFMVDLSFMIAAQRDAQMLLPASFLVMTVLLALLLRSITATVLTLVVITFSVIGAIGLRGYSGIPLTGQSGSVPIIVLTVAIANCVHLLVSFIHGLNLGHEKQVALEESLRINLQPVFIASVSTTFGFLTLNAAEAPPIAWMGNTVAVGVVISFVLSVTLLPGALALLPFGRRHAIERDQLWLEGLGRLLVAKSNLFLLTTSVVIVGVCALVPLNKIEADPFVFFDESFEVRRATDFLAENLTGPVVVDYSLESGEAGGIVSPEFLKHAESFAVWLRAQPEVEHVGSLTDVIKRLNANMHGDDPAWYRLPARRDMTAQYLLLYEMSLPYGLDLNDQIDVERSSIKTTAALSRIDGRDLEAVEKRVQAWLTDNAPDLKTRGQGMQYMFNTLAYANITSLLQGAVVALAIISLLLIVAFRSLKFGLMSLLPNLVPAAMGFGVWALINGNVGLDISVVIGMTLGIIVDDTVHFVSKYLRARRESGLSSQEAVVYAFATVGKALVVTSLVLVAGFLVLSMSGFAYNSRMAGLTAMVIMFALAVDFLFLPPLLMKVDRAPVAAQE